MTLVITPDSVIKQSRLADFVEILNIKISISVAKRYHTVQSSLLLLIANENQPLGSKNYSHFQSKKKKTQNFRCESKHSLEEPDPHIHFSKLLKSMSLVSPCFCLTVPTYSDGAFEKGGLNENHCSTGDAHIEEQRKNPVRIMNWTHVFA